MKKLIDSQETRNKIVSYSISGIIIVLFAFLLFNIGSLADFIKQLIGILSPFLWGVVFAFVMSKFANFLESKFSDRMPFKWKRFISSLISVLLLMVIIFVVVLIISPQLAESVGKISNIVIKFAANSTEWIKNFQLASKLPDNVVTLLYEYSNTLVSSIWSFLKTSIPNIVNMTFDTVSGVLNFVIGFIVALYLLIDRERIIETARKFFKAFLSEKQYTRITIIYNVAVSKFYHFFEAKLIDSLIIGVLCFIMMSIIGLDFSMLISVIVGITNIIPFFGPFIGAIPSALILLMVEPSQALIFILMVLLLQQIDGNIIGPRILGDSVGLSSLWIMFAIIVGGAYFGFFGMLLGVPIFSVIYYLVREEVYKRLSEKEKEEKKEKKKKTKAPD